MNTEISSKLSLYDILAMLIPGALIIFWASNVIFGNDLTIDESRINPWIVGVFFTATSYLVGIMYCKFMELVWNIVFKSCNYKSKGYFFLFIPGFLVVLCLLCSFLRFNDLFSCVLMKLIVLLAVFFITAWLYKADKIVKFFYVLLLLLERNNLKMIEIAYLKIKKETSIEQVQNRSNSRCGNYYEAYAFVAKNTYRNDVHILESQFAFLRSMFGVVLLYEVICLLYSFDLLKDRFESLMDSLFPGVSVCLISICLLLLLIAIPFVMACIQKKIYEIVWEDYKYLHRVKDDK